jgi:tRNA threonylcarbamoyladenosine biosynthesis protein TsaB
LNTIAIDTATETLAIAIRANNDKSIAFHASLGYKHGEILVPWIERLLSTAGLVPSDIGLVVCSSGPGSFTGLRIGLATAKGIAFGSGCSIILVSTLDAIAYNTAFFDGTVLPIIDAKKHRFYTALYNSGARHSDYLDISLEEIARLVRNKGKVLIAGPAAQAVYSGLEGKSEGVMLSMDALPGTSVESLLEIGIAKYNEVKQGDPDTAGPLYIRKSEAEIGIIKHDPAKP